MSTTYAPTAEQQAVIDAALNALRTKTNLVVNAGAGVGKTSTVEAACHAIALAEPQARVLYLVFANKNKVEAEARMPKNVKVATFHGFSFARFAREFGHRIKDKSKLRMPGSDIAAVLGLQGIKITVPMKDPVTGVTTQYTREFTATRLAAMAMKATLTFCHSDSPAIDRKHIAWVRGLDQAHGQALNNQLRDHLMPAVTKAWADLTQPNGRLPFAHEVYLKMFAMECAKRTRPGSYDLVIVDEAQDASLSRLQIARASGQALMVVGDRYQGIMEFAGAVNVMELVDGPQRNLTQSFRWGPAVATVANNVLSILGDFRLRGFDKINSEVRRLEADEIDAILCRTNAECMSNAIIHISAGRKVHVVGGVADLIDFAKGANQLIAGERPDHATLAAFPSWEAFVLATAEDDGYMDLAPWADAVNTHTAPVLVQMLNNAHPTSAGADLTISTAHKSKGLEWDHVKLAGDFFPPKSTNTQALQLLYVAVTRGRKVLDLTAAPCFGYGNHVILSDER